MKQPLGLLSGLVQKGLKMRNFLIYTFFLIAFPAGLLAQPTVVLVGPSGGEALTLKEAFDAINNGDIQGDPVNGEIDLQIVDNTTESATAVLYQSGYQGNSSYSLIRIYPTVSGLVISGNLSGTIIEFNGADNVILDGRVNQTGSADLIVTNTSTSASSTIRFINSAQGNKVKYCYIKGSESNTSGGIIHFSTASSGTGNDGNTIEYNYITSDAAGRPVNAIYSSGTTDSENSGDTIRNNNIYNFFKHGSSSNGVFLSSNTTGWTISGNSFYETASFAPTADASFNTIQINNTSGTNFTVSGNFIGGSAASCGGTNPWTKTNANDNPFVAIYLNVGTGTVSNIQNNTIKYFNWSNSLNSNWTAIQVDAGAVDIGTSTGNQIGETTGTGSITLTGASTGTTFLGINITGTGTVDCRNNSIGSVTIGNSSANAGNFIGINKAAVSGTITISSNSIGSTSEATSIFASSAASSSSQTVQGIVNAGTGTITINGNIIANLTNGTTRASTGFGSGLINGIFSADGTNTISNNTIYNLTIGNGRNTSTHIASVIGIALIGDTPKTVTGNTIYNLSNTFSTFTGSVIGLYFSGNTGSNVVSENFIHSLSVTGGSSTSASIYGIKINSGATTYSNNIISLGGNTATTIYGISDEGSASQTCNLYHNSVYIGGSLGSGVSNLSYALYSKSSSNTRNFRNNIFENSRSTSGGTNKHYSVWFNYGVSTGLTLGNNAYYVSGAGGVVGRYASGNVTTLPLVPLLDAGSWITNPGFAIPGGTSAANYLPSSSLLVAVTGTGITTDYDGGAARSITYPSMGAFEYSVSLPSWTGSAGTDWNTPGNWSISMVPTSLISVSIPNVTNDPVVNEDLSSPAVCNNLILESGSSLTIAAGKALTVSGTLSNNGGTLKLNSSSSSLIASLIVNSYSRGTGAAEEIQLYLTGGAGTLWHYISSPVTSVPTTLFSAVSVRSVTRYEESLISTDWNNGWVNYEGYHYNPVSNQWELTSSPWSTLDAGRGYNYNSTAASRTFTISGAINTDNTPVSLNYASGGAGTAAVQGYNLIGNPFTSSIDWNAVVSSSLNTGQPNWSSVEQTIYYRSNGTLYYYNNSVTVPGDLNGRYLPPMQGCFIKSNINNFNFIIPASARVHNANPRFKGSEVVPMVRLQLDNSGKSEQTVIRFDEKATLLYDNEFDARRLSSDGNVLALNSSLSGTDYVINGIPFPEKTITIPLVVNAPVAGTYVITAKEIAGLENYSVTLTDNDQGFSVNLGVTNSYTFVAPAGKYTGRFVITISSLSNDIPDNESKGSDFKVYATPGMINIQALSESWNGSRGDIRIHDITGRQILVQNKNDFYTDNIIQIPFNFATGIYIVEITSGVKRHVAKVVMRYEDTPNANNY